MKAHRLVLVMSATGALAGALAARPLFADGTASPKPRPPATIRKTAPPPLFTAGFGQGSVSASPHVPAFVPIDSPDRESIAQSILDGRRPAGGFPVESYDPTLAYPPGRDAVASRAPKLRAKTPKVTGPLPPEVISRIVRQNFGRFRLCYENGLRNRPGTRGEIVVKLTITATGSVVGVGRKYATLGDDDVVKCVVKSFEGLTFPEPEGKKTVDVEYTILFEPPG